MQFTEPAVSVGEVLGKPLQCYVRDSLEWKSIVNDRSVGK